MTLSVTPYTEPAESWDAFVRGVPGWTHCHLYGWRRVIEETFGHECLYLAARDRDRLAGVLPLVRVRSLLFGHYLVSMPFLNYGGPLGSADAVRALADAAVRRADADGAKLLELRSTRELSLALPVSHRKVTVVLDLPPGDPESLWEGLKSKVRSQVRRPRKEGVEVRFGPGELDGFYRVFRHHMRDLGTPAQSRGFFTAMRDSFADSVTFACAWLDGQPVAGGCGFRWGDEFEITWASSLVEHKRIAPNMLLYWELMERCVAQGVRRFNFGRCTPGGGTHRFKRQWGGRDEPLWWYQHSGADAEAATPSPEQGAWSLGPRLWRHLPVPVASWLGPHIVRNIP